MLRSRRWIHCLGAVAVVAVVMAVAGDARAQELRYKFEEGEKLLYNMTQEMETQIKAEGVPDQQFSMDQVTEMSWTVEDVQEDGTARINQSIDRIKMNLTAPPKVDFQYDSTAAEEPTGDVARMIQPVLEAMVGAKFAVTMTSRGEVTQVEVPESVVEATQKVPNAAQMGEMFTKEGFGKMIQQGTLTFPEGELGSGREWTETMEVPSPGLGGKLIVTTTYEYLGQEEVEGQTLDAFAVSQEMDFGEAAPAGGKIAVTKQESTGKIYFDREAGHMKSSETKSNVAMEITIFGRTIQQQLQQNVQIDVKLAE